MLKNIITNGLKTGLILAGTTTAAIMLASEREAGQPWAAINAICHAVDGDDVSQPRDYSPRESALGLVINGTAMGAWGVLYEAALAVTGARPGRLTGALASAFAYVVDYRVVPKRFTPGIEKVLSPGSVFVAYVVLGATLAASGRWNRE